MKLILNNAKKILKNKRKIESKLKIKIFGKGNKIFISGGEIDKYLTSCIFEAIEAGFSVENSLLLAEQDYMLEKISIKNFTNRKNLSQIRARLIGIHGKTRELLEELSDCYIKIHENYVYIIGKTDNIKKAINSVQKIIQGSKQSGVYAYLEKQRKIYKNEDLGLKLNKFNKFQKRPGEDSNL